MASGDGKTVVKGSFGLLRARSNAASQPQPERAYCLTTYRWHASHTRTARMIPWK
jgi:hypothetical protein